MDDGESIRAIATASGIEYSILYRFVHGTSGGSADTINKLAKHFGLALCDDDEAE